MSWLNFASSDRMHASRKQRYKQNISNYKGDKRILICISSFRRGPSGDDGRFTPRRFVRISRARVFHVRLPWFMRTGIEKTKKDLRRICFLLCPSNLVSVFYSPMETMRSRSNRKLIMLRLDVDRIAVILPGETLTHISCDIVTGDHVVGGKNYSSFLSPNAQLRLVSLNGLEYNPTSSWCPYFITTQ